MKTDRTSLWILSAKRSILFILILGILGGWVAALPATAQTVADSSAFGESVSLNILPLLGSGLPIASGPLPQLSGTAAPAYNKSANVASAFVTTALTGSLLQTGVINVHASSLMPAATRTHGDAETNGTGLTLGHLIPLLSLNAQVIRSSATVDGTCGSSLVATGTTDLVGVALGGAAGLGVGVPSQPGPNTLLLNLLGIKIILNEQFVSGNGTTNRAITVNAIHIYAQNSLLSGLGVLSGDIVISQSQAHVQCPAASPELADLAVSGTGSPNPVAPGGTLTYTVTIANQGPNPATGVALTDSLPSGVTLTSVSPSQGTCTAGSPIACTLGTIPNGQSAQVIITVNVTATQGTLTNTATATSAVVDPNSVDNTVTTTNQVQAPNPRVADISISGSDSPNPVVAGGVITYTIAVTNHGPDPATGATMIDSLPSGVTFISAAPGQGSCTPGNPVSCNLGTVANGQAVQVTIKGTVTATQGTLVDSATAASDVADPSSGNNSLTMSSMIQVVSGPKADLSVGVTADASSVLVGQTVRVTFTITNNGSDTATSVVLADGAVGRATVNSVTPSQGNCTDGDSIVCNFGSLASGAHATVTMVVTALSAGTMTCSGDVSSSVPDPDPSNNGASALVQVIARATAPPIDPGACRIDAVPAATLLIPYFEVDLDHFNGATTLISINNAHAASQLAQVTIWTDWGIPTLSFTIALSGFDVQTLNLRDVIGQGILPGVATGAGCASQTLTAGSLSQSFMGHLHAWHTGQQSPLQGNCAAPARVGNVATGYITVDAVNRCSNLNPTDPGYFLAGGQGVASDNNVLWGDFFLVNGDENQAHGDPDVHILAEPGVFRNHYSFYSTFVGGSGADDRQPLGTSYASRYLAGGAFDGGTQLIVWRDAKVANPKAVQCGQEPDRMTLGGTAYDEDENATAIIPSKQMAPWSTQKMTVGGGSLPLPHAFGWVHLDLWHTGGTVFGDVAQGWVTTVMSAQKRYSVGLRAIRLDSACDF